MRPKTVDKEIPYRRALSSNIDREFSKLMIELKDTVLVRSRLISSAPLTRLSSLTIDFKSTPGRISITLDAWSRNKSDGSFLGGTMHYINVDGLTWRLASKVFCFYPITGRHDGENLGQYLLGLLDRVGITSPTHNKVHTFFAFFF